MSNKILKEKKTETIEITKEYKRCIKAIKKGIKFLFISGKAGVGKSVLIKFLKHKLRKKNILLVAPTGIASINIEGQTIHSLFGFKIDLLTKNNIEKPKGGTSEVFNKTDIIIIDEISMVRADLLDAIDISLRLAKNNDEPFGGIQIVAVGDLYQLSPIIKKEEKIYFKEFYKTEFFFSAKVFEKIKIYPIILNKVFRQNDGITIEALNKIRLNVDHREAVAYINRNCYGINKEFRDIPRDITLTTTNYNSEKINNFKLKEIKSKEHTYIASIDGVFKTKLTTPNILKLKIGAKVMFTKNTDEFANGTLGIIKELNEDIIVVTLLSNNKNISVSRSIWENKKYQVNPNTEEITQITLGSFRQFPLTLAWAITIHKSQGLTLDNMRIDLSTGAFASGQVYVALSRCKSLSTISLTKPISMKDIKLDSRIIDFYKDLDFKIAEIKKEEEED